MKFEDFSLDEKQLIAKKLFNDYQKKVTNKHLKNINWKQAYNFIMYDVKNCNNFRQIRSLIEEEFAYELIKKGAFKNS